MNTKIDLYLPSLLNIQLTLKQIVWQRVKTLKKRLKKNLLKRRRKKRRRNVKRNQKNKMQMTIQQRWSFALLDMFFLRVVRENKMVNIIFHDGHI